MGLRFRFACQAGCTNCCRQAGFVYLTEGDLTRAAARLGISAQDFEARYVYRTRHSLRLRKPRGSPCHFLADRGCLLHPAKPAQCRLYPFWPELVSRPGAWRRAAAVCPGIGCGPVIPRRLVLARAQRMRRAYPDMYGK